MLQLSSFFSLRLLGGSFDVLAPVSRFHRRMHWLSVLSSSRRATSAHFFPFFLTCSIRVLSSSSVQSYLFTFVSRMLQYRSQHCKSVHPGTCWLTPVQFCPRLALATPSRMSSSVSHFPCIIDGSSFFCQRNRHSEADRESITRLTSCQFRVPNSLTVSLSNASSSPLQNRFSVILGFFD